MNCGDSLIDGLLAGETSIRPLTSGARGHSVAYLQELLRGHGYVFLPDPRSASYGVYGLSTRSAVMDYRRKHGLAAGDMADSAMLQDMVRRAAPKAVLGPAYAPLVLNLPFDAITRFVWLTSLFETSGRFCRLNLNTDQCGVSFGILQWSQKAGQLHLVLRACCTRQPAEWSRTMGATGILDHLARPDGGVDERGHSCDPNYELTKEPWKSKLQALGTSRVIQGVQIEFASQGYTAALARAREYAPEIRSERGFAFLLDLANQFGGWRVERSYEAAASRGGSEAEILKRLEDSIVSIARPQFQPQVRARREFFRTSSVLSDQPLPRQ